MAGIIRDIPVQITKRPYYSAGQAAEVEDSRALQIAFQNGCAPNLRICAFLAKVARPFEHTASVLIRGPMGTVQSPTTFKFPKAASLSEIEAQIRDIDKLHLTGDIYAFVASNYGRNFLTDMWSGLAIGTLLRKGNYCVGVPWGISRDGQFIPKRFSQTPPGLVTTALANNIIRDGAATPEDMSEVKNWISTEKGGYLGNEEESQGTERWIVEFDDSRALSLITISDHDERIGRSAFDQIIARVREELEIWWSREQKSNLQAVTEHATAKANLTEFIKELFENAYQHGRRTSEPGNYVPNLRFIRFRKFVGTQKDLVRRAGSDVAILESFVNGSLQGERESAFLEISISDFGYGILDAFLMTPTGKKHQDRGRAEVFRELLYNNLTSNSFDPAAGRGIFNALHAALKLKAFVSLRTNEFWWAKNFAGGASDILLEDSATQPLGKVAGTHWQFIWAPPPL